MISEISRDFANAAERALCAKCMGYSTATRRNKSASRKIREGAIVAARHQLAERLGRRRRRMRTDMTRGMGDPVRRYVRMQ